MRYRRRSVKRLFFRPCRVTGPVSAPRSVAARPCGGACGQRRAAKPWPCSALGGLGARPWGGPLAHGVAAESRSSRARHCGAAPASHGAVRLRAPGGHSGAPEPRPTGARRKVRTAARKNPGQLRRGAAALPDGHSGALKPRPTAARRGAVEKCAQRCAKARASWGAEESAQRRAKTSANCGAAESAHSGASKPRPTAARRRVRAAVRQNPGQLRRGAAAGARRAQRRAKTSAKCSAARRRARTAARQSPGQSRRGPAAGGRRAQRRAKAPANCGATRPSRGVGRGAGAALGAWSRCGAFLAGQLASAPIAWRGNHCRRGGPGNLLAGWSGQPLPCSERRLGTISANPSRGAARRVARQAERHGCAAALRAPHGAAVPACLLNGTARGANRRLPLRPSG